MGRMPLSASNHVGAIAGYRIDDVDAFVAGVRDEQASLSAELQQAQAELASLQGELAATPALPERLGGLVLEAQRAARLRRQATDEAVSRLVQEAEAEAERLLVAARATATERRSPGSTTIVGANGHRPGAG